MNVVDELLRRKPMPLVSVADSDQRDPFAGHTLRRALTRGSLLLYGIGATLGSGVFVLTGEAIADYAGPATVISYLIGGIACLFCCCCYAEFACRVPLSGSAYAYTYVSLGEL